LDAKHPRSSVQLLQGTLFWASIAWLFLTIHGTAGSSVSRSMVPDVDHTPASSSLVSDSVEGPGPLLAQLPEDQTDDSCPQSRGTGLPLRKTAAPSQSPGSELPGTRLLPSVAQLISSIAPTVDYPRVATVLRLNPTMTSLISRECPDRAPPTLDTA